MIEIGKKYLFHYNGDEINTDTHELLVKENGNTCTPYDWNLTHEYLLAVFDGTNNDLCVREEELEEIKEGDKTMSKIIFKEVPAVQMETDWFFEDQGFSGEENEKAELFILLNDWRGGLYGFNADDFTKIAYENDLDLDDKDIIEKVIAALETKTGAKWNSTKAFGYCQGEIATVIACEDIYTEDEARSYAEIYLGACKEFLSEDNCSFYVADCQVTKTKDYKTVLADMAGYDVEDIEVQMISGEKTVTIYTYETI